MKRFYQFWISKHTMDLFIQALKLTRLHLVLLSWIFVLVMLKYVVKGLRSTEEALLCQQPRVRISTLTIFWHDLLTVELWEVLLRQRTRHSNPTNLVEIWKRIWEMHIITASLEQRWAKSEGCAPKTTGKGFSCKISVMVCLHHLV